MGLAPAFLALDEQEEAPGSLATHSGKPMPAWTKTGPWFLLRKDASTLAHSADCPQC
jgi:hypothetical protein